MQIYNGIPGQGYRYRRQPFTEHETSIVALGFEARWTDTQIARALGRPEEAVKRHRRRRGLYRYRPTQGYTEREAGIVALGIKAGWSDKKIARKLGRSPSSVKSYRWLRGLLKRRRRGCLSPVTMMLAIILASADSPASAHDPGEPYAEWYQSLMRPEGGSCCSMNRDCQPVEYRMSPPLAEGDSEYEAVIHDHWVRVPKHAVLARHDNPTGSAVLCIAHASDYILCFVPADSY